MQRTEKSRDYQEGSGKDTSDTGPRVRFKENQPSAIMLYSEMLPGLRKRQINLGPGV